MKNRSPYTVVFEMQEQGFDTYREAAEWFMQKTMDALFSGGFTGQGLETTCWVEQRGRYYRDFYQCRDDCHDNGWQLPENKREKST